MKNYLFTSGTDRFAQFTKLALALVLSAALTLVFMLVMSSCASTAAQAELPRYGITVSDPRVKHQEPINTPAYRVAHNLK